MQEQSKANTKANRFSSPPCPCRWRPIPAPSAKPQGGLQFHPFAPPTPGLPARLLLDSTQGLCPSRPPGPCCHVASTGQLLSSVTREHNRISLPRLTFPCGNTRRGFHDTTCSHSCPASPVAGLSSSSCCVMATSWVPMSPLFPSLF